MIAHSDTPGAASQGKSGREGEMFPLFPTPFDRKTGWRYVLSGFKFLYGKQMRGVSVFRGKVA